jgi:hypothetical protein
MRSGVKPLSRAAIGFSVLCVFAVWALFALGPQYMDFPVDQRGQWGDTFGGLTAIFSGLAMLGAAYAVLLQNRQLEATRRELRNDARAREKTDRLMGRQAHALLAQAKITAALALMPAQQSNFGKKGYVDGSTGAYSELEISKQYIRIILNDVESYGTSSANRLPPGSSVYRRHLYAVLTRCRHAVELPNGKPRPILFEDACRAVRSAIVEIECLGCHDAILSTGDLLFLNHSREYLYPYSLPEPSPHLANRNWHVGLIAALHKAEEDVLELPY